MNIIKATQIQPGREKNPIWKDSDPGRELKSIFLDDKEGTYLAMPAKELQDLQETFKVYAKSTFKNYTMVLKNEVMKENKNQPKPWKDNTAEAHAKTFLLQDFETHHAMNSDVFWKLDPLFQQYPLEFFETHLDQLKIEIEKNKDVIKVDEVAFCHD